MSNVLIGCEFSGVVRDAFLSKGHYAISCDFLDTESKIKTNHYKGDIRDILEDKRSIGFWDLFIVHPPCTNLAISGARYFSNKLIKQIEDMDFINYLLTRDIPKICLENPIGIISTHIRKPDQILQPWQFGHGETKATCLWLKGLPLLKATNIVPGRQQRIHNLPPSKDRWKKRSITYQGIAYAMANQWG